MGTCWRIKWRPLNDCIFIALTHKKELAQFLNPIGGFKNRFFISWANAGAKIFGRR